MMRSLFLLGCFAAAGAIAMPTKSVKLTVSGYTGEETLVNFPVAVRLTAATPGFDYTKCQPDGADISFRLADGMPLNREIESWDPEGESIVWVSLPELKAGSEFFLDYSDKAQTEQPASQTDGSVWSAAGYKLVMHFASGADFLKDSIAKTDEKITRYGGSEVSGFLGGGLSLPGGSIAESSVAIVQGNVTTMTDKSKCTVSFRFKKKANTIGHGSRIFCGNKSANGAAFDIMQWNSGSGANQEIGLCIRGSGSGGNGIVTLKPADFDWSAWNLFGVVFDGTSVQAYTNGYATAMKKSTITAISDFSSNPIYVGNYGGGSGIAGAFDECRIRDGVSSSDWMLAEEQVAGTGFLSAEMAEVVGDSLLVTTDGVMYGTPSPDWGRTNGLAVGDAFICSIPACYTNEDEGVFVEVTGWRLFDAEENLVDSGTTASFTYTHVDFATLRWDFDPVLNYRVTATAGDGGSVDKSVAWVRDGGSVSVTAVPAAGRAFHHWVTPNGNVAENPLTVTPSAAVDLEAVFATLIDLAPGGATIDETVAAIGDGIGEIRLEEGEYELVGAVTLSSGVRIIGAGRDLTTVRAASGKQAFVITHPDAVLSGLTVAGRKTVTSGTSSGGLVKISDGMVSDCRVTGGRYNAISTGAGVYMTGGTILRTLFDDNRITGGYSRGGALYMSNGHVDCCLFTNNDCRAYGGAVYMEGGRLVGSTIMGNTVELGDGYGAGLSVNSASASVVNCVICGNTALSGVATGERCAEWHCAAANEAAFVNCATPVEVGSGHRTVDVTHFTADGHLTAKSACIDAAAVSADEVSATDFDGNPRVLGETADIGCFEYMPNGFECAFELSPTRVFAGSEVSFTAFVRGFDAGETIDCRWTVSSEDLDDLTFDGATVSQVLATPGSYTVKLEVVSARDASRRTESISSNCLLVARRRVDLVPGDDLAAAAASGITGTKIYLAAGDYTVSSEVALDEGVEVLGAGEKVTCVTRSGSTPHIFRLNHPAARLSGVTVTGGTSFDAGNSSKNGAGAGVLIDVGGGTVTDCVITKCSCADNGYGAAACLSEDGLFDRVVFTGNKKFHRGGGLCLARGRCRNSLFTDNTASVGGAIYVAMVANVAADAPVVENCTITANNAYGSYPNSGGVGVDGETGVAFRNCILIGNTSDKMTDVEPHVDWRGGSYVNCLFATEAARSGTNPVIGSPERVFRNPEHGNCRLKRDSPAVNAGTPLVWMTGATDLRGDQRLRGEAPDIGAYEHQLNGLRLLVR